LEFLLSSTVNHILKVGITGGIGSGKTTVCEIFTRLGLPVLRSDDIAKEISNSDPGIRSKLIALLGSEAYLLDTSLNRPFIASKIFSDKVLQRKVESIIHPKVEKERNRRIAELSKQGHWMMIIEAALIYEAGLDKKLDAVVVVNADEDLRIKRTCARLNISEVEVRARISAQLDVQKKLEKAEYSIQNNGSLEELESKVRFLYTIFQLLAREEKRA
jgi:dephospho-CoA kinase